MWHTFLVNQSTIFVWGQERIPLDGISLNITRTSEGEWPNIISPGLEYVYYSLSFDTMEASARQGDYYNASYVHSHGSCKPSETYQWGFSYIFLFMVSIFNFVWSCIMVGMWWDTVRGSRMYRTGRRPGLLRSVLDLARVIREELGNEEVERMGEEEIKKGLRDSGGRMTVPKQADRIGRINAEDGREGRKRSWKYSLTKGSTF